MSVPSADVLARLAHAHALDGDLLDALAVRAEHDVALQDRGRVVEVHDRLLRADQRLVGASDQVLAGLGQHLDGDVVRDQVLLDQHPDEVEVGLARRGEADLDLLVAHPHEQLEHPPLAVRGHRVDQGLVAVAQVDRAPAGGLGDHPVGPRAVGEAHAELGVVRDVAVDGHARGLLEVLHDRFCSCAMRGLRARGELRRRGRRARAVKRGFQADDELRDEEGLAAKPRRGEEGAARRTGACAHRSTARSPASWAPRRSATT